MPHRTTTTLLDLVKKADAARHQGCWQEAAMNYEASAQALPKNPAIQHNLALSLFSLGKFGKAIEHAQRAVELAPQLWQAELVLSKIEVAMGFKEVAIERLTGLHQRYPDNPDIRLELASQQLHELGNAQAAKQLVAPLLNRPETHRDAILTLLVSSLYDRDNPTDSALNLNEGFKKFAQKYVIPVLPSQENRLPHPKGGVIRVGLISTQFRASPVYYLTIGALKNLADKVELVFLHRGQQEDWATERFKRIASLWLDVSALDASQLNQELKRLNLNALFDLSGWMDPIGLQALANKPVGKQFKWVGGQSITTGLSCFDGWLTDIHQTPRGHQQYYTEPLIYLDGGYVTYTPPDYFPTHFQPQKQATQRLGIIANPAKVSRHFLAILNQRIEEHSRNESTPIILRFIDRRYRHPLLQKRIIQQLPALSDNKCLVEFVTPPSHLAFLNAVAECSAAIDTFPYTGGLTTLEALFLGIPCFTSGTGKLYCERHTYAHCRLTGIKGKWFELDTFQACLEFTEKNRAKLLCQMQQRTDHLHLAKQLFALVDSSH